MEVLIILFILFLILLFDIFLLFNHYIFSTIFLTIFLVLSLLLLVYYFYKKSKRKRYCSIIPGRESLLKHLKNCENNKNKALILINIDSFDEINDFFGYDFGDKVLEEMMFWLEKNLPNNNSKLYKLEADNFAIYTEAFRNGTELEIYLKKLSNRISNTNFIIYDNELDIDFTMGAAINQSNLLNLTHIAYKRSKTKKTQYEIFSEKIFDNSIYNNNININKMIKKSIQNEKIIPFFQPIYNIKLQKIDKYESLMRIQKNDNSYMKPNEFLNIAKHSKLYPKLTKEIFKKVTNNIISPSIEYSINLSVHDILDKDTSSFILKKLENSDIGTSLVFEILESEGIKNYKEVTSFLKNLKLLGAKLAIDDFGSGYSNFEYILKLDIDYLKIDGSLIKNIDINEDTQIITSTIVDFAKKLKIKTIAEFVHNENIYKIIKNLGFDYAQGFYIGKPQKDIDLNPKIDHLKDQTIFDFV